MDFDDLMGAIEDMLGFHGANLADIIYIRDEKGELKKLDGFYVNDDGKIYLK